MNLFPDNQSFPEILQFKVQVFKPIRTVAKGGSILPKGREAAKNKPKGSKVL